MIIPAPAPPSPLPWPLPKLRLQIDDLEHEGADVFLDNVNPKEALAIAVGASYRWLYTADNPPPKSVHLSPWLSSSFWRLTDMSVSSNPHAFNTTIPCRRALVRHRTCWFITGATPFRPYPVSLHVLLAPDGSTLHSTYPMLLPLPPLVLG
ncbi:hypothetical protein FA13DRAFT_1724697 [Coprinellus micaceus]|jgi:hypothetical protein|uniref:Uncharacterized protein n=1 Tax=Coprinellus micaceus TaxID=71717 RepID=A0A4Y7TX58_COPMI|nr:hypothetical protein FA13DRAFT_1724697 [Coprinellus micaceus]